MTRKYDFWIYITIIILLGILYIACFKAAERGYGYAGYRGYHHHHSFWYYRGYDEGFYPSNRENSVNGNKFSQKGLQGGK